MKPFNCVETIAITVMKQIDSNSFKYQIANELVTCKSGICIYINVSKQIIDFKLFL